MSRRFFVSCSNQTHNMKYLITALLFASIFAACNNPPQETRHVTDTSMVSNVQMQEYTLTNDSTYIEQKHVTAETKKLSPNKDVQICMEIKSGMHGWVGVSNPATITLPKNIRNKVQLELTNGKVITNNNPDYYSLQCRKKGKQTLSIIDTTKTPPKLLYKKEIIFTLLPDPFALLGTGLKKNNLKNILQA